MQEAAQFVGLHHIGVWTSDIEKSSDFYKKLGMEPYYQKTLPNGTRLAFLSVGSAVIELIQHVDPAPLAARSDGFVDHIALTVKNIDALVERLKEHGIAFDTEKAGDMPTLFANGAKNIFLRGPSGERIEFFEEL